MPSAGSLAGPPVAGRIEPSDALVLGVGDPSRMDLGLGVYAAALARGRLPGDVRVLTEASVGPTTLAELDGVSHVLVLDCLDVGREPGTIVSFEPDDLSPCASRSVYGFGVADLLVGVGQTTHALEEAVVLGMQPGSTAPGHTLTEGVWLGMPSLIRQAASIVAEWLGADWSASPRMRLFAPCEEEARRPPVGSSP